MTQQLPARSTKVLEKAGLAFSKHLSGSFHPAAEARSTGLASLWNSDTSAAPFALVRCGEVNDLRLALRIAGEHGLPVSVLAGGHDPSTRSIRDGAVVLDVRKMNSVSLDAKKRLVTVGGGTLTGDVIHALPRENVIVTGTVRSVGLASFTMGGGYGRLNSYFGLALDQLEGAEILLANGSQVFVDATHEPELFWAIRGGGGNFGIATSLTYRVQSVPTLLSGLIFFPLHCAKQAMLNLQGEIDSNARLSLFSSFILSPTGEPVFLLAPLWIGDRDEGERKLADIAAWEGAQVVQRGWSHYRELFSGDFEKMSPKGAHYRLDVQSAGRIDESLAEALISGARTFTSPMSAIVIHDFHGSAADVASADTAFPLRQNHYTLQVIAGWQPGDERAGEHQEWAQSLSRELSKSSFHGAYVNLLHSDDTERVQAFYGDAAARLIKAKRVYDPDGVFTAPGALPSVAVG